MCFGCLAISSQSGVYHCWHSRWNRLFCLCFIWKINQMLIVPSCLTCCPLWSVSWWIAGCSGNASHRQPVSFSVWKLTFMLKVDYVFVSHCFLPGCYGPYWNFLLYWNVSIWSVQSLIVATRISWLTTHNVFTRCVYLSLKSNIQPSCSQNIKMSTKLVWDRKIVKGPAGWQHPRLLCAVKSADARARRVDWLEVEVVKAP